MSGPKLQYADLKKNEKKENNFRTNISILIVNILQIFSAYMYMYACFVNSSAWLAGVIAIAVL